MRNRRSLQDPGKYLSQYQHRDGQRTKGSVSADRNRYLGGHRRRQDQTIWVSSFLPRTWAGWTLHSHRSVLLELGCTQARNSHQVHRTAGEINTSMPLYVVHRLSEALNEAGKPIRGSKIGIFGVAYKKDVDDPRESPSFKLMELLGERGAELSYSDPHIPSLPKMRHYDVPELKHNEPTPEYLASLDCVLIATDHTAFDWDEIVKHAQLVVDTRNATKLVTEGREKIHKA